MAPFLIKKFSYLQVKVVDQYLMKMVYWSQLRYQTLKVLWTI